MKIHPNNIPRKAPVWESIILGYIIYDQSLPLIWLVIGIAFGVFIWIRWLVSLNHKRIDVANKFPKDLGKSWVEERQEKYR